MADKTMSDEITTPSEPTLLSAPLETTFLSFDDILSVETASFVPTRVYLPAWSGHVLLKPLKESDILAIEKKASLGGTRNPQRVKILSIKASLIEPALTFTQIQQLLVEGRAAPIAQLWTEINKVNGMGEAAIEEADATFSDEPADGDDLLDS
jgi:hypothetical protein